MQGTRSSQRWGLARLSFGLTVLLAAVPARAGSIQLNYGFPADDHTATFTPTAPAVLDIAKSTPGVGSGETIVDSHGQMKTFFSTVPPESTQGPFTVVGILDDIAHLTGTGTATISLHTTGFGVLAPPDPRLISAVSFDSIVTSLSVSDGTPQHLATAQFANQPRAGYTLEPPGVPIPIDLRVSDSLTIPGALNVNFVMLLRAEGINGASLDLFHTALLSFDLSPGVSVTTDGGFFQSGSTAVPESSTVSLLATGVAGLLGYRRLRGSAVR